MVKKREGYTTASREIYLACKEPLKSGCISAVLQLIAR